MSKYGKTIYDQLVEVIDKLDKVLAENKKLNKSISELKNIIKEKDQELENKDNLIKNLVEEIERLKNQINKNSTNSSKPSSTNIVTPKENKTSANEYNSRVKSGKKPGGQKNHKGKNLSKKKAEKMIKEGKVEVREIKHFIKGKKKENVVKYKYGIEIKPYIEKHIFIYREKVEDVLPKEYYTDVTYDNSIKTLCIEMQCHNLISYDRMSEFLRVITDGVLNISVGSLFNFGREFSNKSKDTLANLETNLLNGKNIRTDETTSKYKGKNMYTRNYSNDETALYKSHLHKGHNPIKEDNILPRFQGGIMGDHDTTLYSYGTNNYECNVHVIRYLEELIQNVPHLQWSYMMKDLLLRMYINRSLAIKYKISSFDDETIKYYKDEYDKILEIAKEENKEITSSYYKPKSEKLYRRFIKYKDNHLYFIQDFDVPFDNNSSERDLRVYKGKTKVSGGFRSLEGANNFADALSIVKTSKKRNINPYNSIQSIFDGETLFA